MHLKYFIVILASFLFSLAIPKTIFAEKIDDFTSRIEINKNGTISVSENITYNFEDVYRHGIFRTLNSVNTNAQRKKFRLNFTNFHVLDEKGTAYQFDESQERDNIQLKIGDPNRTITGMHTYRIDYQIAGAITYFSDHDEFYWNITGNGWEVPIEKSNVEISLPTVVDSADIKLTCYTGLSGSTSTDCTSSYQDGKATFQSKNILNPSEGLTIVVGFPKNIVAILEPQEVINFEDTPLGKIVSIIFLAAFIIVAIFWYLFYPIRIIWKWYRGGRDPQSPMGVASSWYDPPVTKDHRKLTPGETGTLIDETADMEDISATIVDLARRGYIKIVEEKKNDFSLEKTKDWKNEKNIQPFEEKLLSGIFDGDDAVRLKDADLIETVNDTKTALYESVVKNGFFLENPDTVRKFYTVIGSIALFTLNIPLALISFIFGRNMPKKTPEGAQAANIAKSLKNFLSSQERQLKFQAKNQMFFEKLLPFAVAFGVEKIWADRFKNINLKPPTWYQGYGNNAFTSYLLVSSLSSSFRSVTAAATPTSSSSGFSSGFSGGSSGGGGGGGGGGSW